MIVGRSIGVGSVFGCIVGLGWVWFTPHYVSWLCQLPRCGVNSVFGGLMVRW